MLLSETYIKTGFLCSAWPTILYMDHYNYSLQVSGFPSVRILLCSEQLSIFVLYYIPTESCIKNFMKLNVLAHNCSLRDIKASRNCLIDISITLKWSNHQNVSTNDGKMLVTGSKGRKITIKVMGFYIYRSVNPSLVQSGFKPALLTSHMDQVCYNSWYLY